MDAIPFGLSFLSHQVARKLSASTCSVDTPGSAGSPASPVDVWRRGVERFLLSSFPFRGEEVLMLRCPL